MSGIKSLLQYRFQRKEGDKLPPSSSEKDPEPTTPVKNECNGQSIPDTPDSQRCPSPGSPVLGSWSKRRGARILSDSDSEQETTPTKPSSSSSAWLSKPKAKTTNGTSVSASAKVKVEKKHVPKPSSSQKPGDREFMVQVNSLLEMFPTLTKDIATEALKSTSDFEKAIDFMISYNTAGPTKKRARQMSQLSSDSEPAPPTKKSRQLSYEDSFEDTPEFDSQATILLEDSESQYDDLPDHITKESYKEQITFLREAFCNIPMEVLQNTLKNQNYNVDTALDALATYDPESHKPMSMTKSHGSIKFFQAARSQVQRTKKKILKDEEDDEESDDDSDVADDDSGSGTQRRKGKSRIQVFDVPSDDDDDAADGLGKEGEESKTILDFFNDATVEELSSVNGCSKKKAEYIIEIRPFADWDDLVSKFENSPTGKSLSFSLISNCKEVMKIRNIVKKLMQRCIRLSGDLENFVADLTNKTDMDDDDNDKGYVTKQPTILNDELQLAPYQLIGLNWFILMHHQELNGILGDEMGLGKTIQTIAFLTHLLEQGEEGPHVIIAPSSTIDNWLRELKKWSPELKVLLYYGSQEDRKEIRYSIADGTCEEFNVVVTSYNLASGSVEDRVFFKKTKFQYSIFDEGHMLKNMTSQRYQSLMKIRAEKRVLLTGTPMQNNLIELMSLLAFVMPDLFTGKTEHMKKIFQSINSSGSQGSRGNYEIETIAHAKKILQPFFLRRTKSQVLQQLPKKKEMVEFVPLAFEQQDLYDDLKTQFSDDFRKSLKETSNGKSRAPTTAGSAMLMQLRKAANHHLLHRRQYDATRLRQMAKLMIKEPTHRDANVDYIYEDMEVLSDFELHQLCKQYRGISMFQLDQEQITDSGKFRKLDELLPMLKEKGDRVLLFSQFVIMMDIMEPYLKSRKYKYIRLDGSTPVAERQTLIDRYNTDESIFIFMLSTKAGGLGINLTAANSVILHDIDFNPYNDKQAEDRCHRVGQTREVTIYRLISKGTIEEGMYKVAQCKLQLEADVTGSSKRDDVETGDVASLLKEALDIENGADK